MMPTASVRAALRAATQRLTAAGCDTPQLDAEVLLAFTLNQSRTWLLTYPEFSLDNQQQEQFLSLVKRRGQREPVAYIVGRKEFWSMDLEVNRNVLIPRPETECLVERALESLAAGPNPGRKSILELGTGCGAVVLALASENSRHSYVGTDISSDAVRVARRNSMRHGMGAKIRFIIADWFAPFDAKYESVSSLYTFINGPIRCGRPEL